MTSRIEIRVYYEDTDFGGVVYYANYLRYMERGRTELLRERGISLEEYHRQGIIFAVTEVAVKYRAGARYNDLLRVETTFVELGSLALTFETRISNQKGVLLNTSTTKLVCVGPNGKASRIPQGIAEILAKQ